MTSIQPGGDASHHRRLRVLPVLLLAILFGGAFWITAVAVVATLN